MRAARLSADELRDLYRDDYVRNYHQQAGGRLEALLPLMDLHPDQTVADLGCGNGLMLDMVQGRVGRYFGVDFSSEFIEQARRRHANTQATERSFHCESIVDFCQAHAGQIDRAFLMDFTEHLYDDDLLPLLEAARESLKPDGRLYVHTPNRAFFLELVKEYSVLLQLPGHVAVRGFGEYSRLFRQAGFREVTGAYVPHYLPALAWMHRLSPVPLLGKFCQARLFIECGP